MMVGGDDEDGQGTIGEARQARRRRLGSEGSHSKYKHNDATETTRGATTTGKGEAPVQRAEQMAAG